MCEVRNIDRTGFEVHVEESDDGSGTHLDEDVAWIAGNVGVFKFMNQTFEFGRTSGEDEEPITVELENKYLEDNRNLFAQIL